MTNDNDKYYDEGEDNNIDTDKDEIALKRHAIYLGYFQPQWARVYESYIKATSHRILKCVAKTKAKRPELSLRSIHRPRSRLIPRAAHLHTHNPKTRQPQDKQEMPRHQQDTNKTQARTMKNKQMLWLCGSDLFIHL
jgi:hypothetical protein